MHDRSSSLTRSERKQGQRGMTIPMVALCIVVLLVFAAMAVDLGILYSARTSAQHVADAAALSGAYTFVKYSTAPQPETAQAQALDTASQSYVMGKQVTADSVTVAVDTDKRQVTVTVPRVGANAIETFFAGIMGIKNVGVAATATAEASQDAAGTTCLRPLYMPITAGYTVDKNTGYCTGQPMFQDQQLTEYGKSMIGHPLELWSDIVPGQWGLLDLGPGGSSVRDTLSQCSSDNGLQAACNSTMNVDTENGRKVGPVTQGVANLIGSNDGTCPAKGADYLELDSNGNAVMTDGIPTIYDGQTDQVKSSSRSIVTVAVWDCLHNTITPGKQQIQIVGFASVFIACVDKDKGSNYIKGYLLGVGACGPGSNYGNGPQAIPVRLVQPSGD